MSGMALMESPLQGEVIEAPSAQPPATNGGGGSGLGGDAGRFECSLGLDEQVKNMRHFINRFKYYITFDDDIAWGVAAIERLRTDPCVDVQTLGLGNGQSVFWKGVTALHVAVIAGDFKLVQKILEPDFVLDIDGRMGLEERDCTALHLAAESGNVNIVDALVKKGADQMLLDNQKRTILHVAVLGGHQHVVEWILGRFPSLLNAPDARQRTPIHLASNPAIPSTTKEMVGVVKSLCQCQDIDVKALDSNGWSAFYWAVFTGNVEVVIEFLDCCKDKTRLNEACDRGRGPQSKLLLKRDTKI